MVLIRCAPLELAGSRGNNRLSSGGLENVGPPFIHGHLEIHWKIADEKGPAVLKHKSVPVLSLTVWKLHEDRAQLPFRQFKLLSNLLGELRNHHAGAAPQTNRCGAVVRRSGPARKRTELSNNEPFSWPVIALITGQNRKITHGFTFLPSWIGHQPKEPRL